MKKEISKQANPNHSINILNPIIMKKIILTNAIGQVGLFLVFLGLVVFFLVGCDQSSPSYSIEKREFKAIPFTFDQIEIEGDLGSFSHEFSSNESENGLQIVTLKITSDQAASPPKFKVKWNIPSLDIYQYWNSNIKTDKVTYYGNDLRSRASSQVPLISYMNSGDQNRFTLALSDALNKINTYSWLREEDSKFYFSIELFSEPHHKIKEYELEFRIDRREIPFYQAVKECTEWWAGMENYKPASVPDLARMPMYSTWYSFHQNLDVEEVIKECRLLKMIN